MNTNRKGSIGLTKIISKFTEQGYECYIPLSGYVPIDLIVVNETMIPKRLQIKYRKIERGKIILPFESVINGERILMNFDFIDGWVVYCPDTDEIYYINKSDIDMSKKCFSIRILETKNKQNNSIISYQKYLDIKRLW